MIRPRLVSSLALGVALAGCGAGVQPNDPQALGTPRAAALKVDAADPAGSSRQVLLHFKDQAQLNELATKGIDLFENVDPEKKTVGATLDARTEPVVRAMGVAVDTMRLEASQGFPAGYHTVDQVYADMRAMAKAHPGYVQLVEFGRSLETTQGRAKRPMLALRITAKPKADLPSIRLGGGIHARELPPVELMTRFAHTLVDGYGHDAAVTKLVDTKDIWIVPLQNPDGRAKVESGSTMWRKNTRQDANSPQGVDCNRNADEHFYQGDADAWADDYRGSAPFSEPETQALRDLAIKRQFDMSFDMHCYGGMVLWPPGYDNSVTRDEATFQRIGGTIGKQVGYRAGTIARTIYQAYGDNTTWEYTHLKTIAFAAELDSGSFNPAYGEVDRQWAKWKAPLMYLVSQAQHVKH